MSSITFRTENEYASLAGRERYHMGYVIGHIFCGLLPTKAEEIARLTQDEHLKSRCQEHKELLSQGQYRAAGDLERSIFETFRLSANLGFNHEMQVGSESIDSWCAQLNTVMAIGSEPLKVMAKIHGQCEIHAYIKPEDREWLADVIEEGLECKLYRQKMGWQSVQNLLRDKESPGVVVTSYSVTDSFSPKNWEKGIAKLTKDRGLAISPETLKNQYFGHNVNIFDIQRYAYGIEEVAHKS